MIRFVYSKFELYLHPDITILSCIDAGVMELVDMLDLGSSAARCESSSLSACTEKLFSNEGLFLFSDFFNKVMTRSLP